MTAHLNRRDVLRTLGLSVVATLWSGQSSAGRLSRGGTEEARFFVGTFTRGTSEGIYGCMLHLTQGDISVDSVTGGIINPSYLAIDVQRGRLFSVSEVAEYDGMPTGSVTAFTLDLMNGGLRFIGSQPTGGTGPCYVSTSGDGRFVLVANYSGGTVAVLPVDAGGKLGEPTSVVRHTGSSIKARQEGPHPHSILLDHQSRFAYAADLGLDKVMIYRFDASDGRLVPATPPFASLSPGAGPRHLTFSVDGTAAYVVNELDSTLSVFSVDRSTGELRHLQTISTLPPGTIMENYPADVHVHPSGTFVYCSNRGHDSIAAFRVSPETGRLSALFCEPTRGKWPRNFAIDPTGRYLLVANQRSNSIVVFAIEQTTGVLTPAGYSAEVPSPVCIKFLPV